MSEIKDWHPIFLFWGALSLARLIVLKKIVCIYKLVVIVIFVALRHSSQELYLSMPFT